MRRFRKGVGAVILGVAVARAVTAGCKINKPAEEHFYDEHIQPILNTFCVGNTSPCHSVDPATGVALGNLDLSSFEARSEAARRAAHLRQLSAAAAAAEGAARLDDPDPLPRDVLRQRDPAQRRQAAGRRTPTRTSSSRTGWTTAPTATASRRCPSPTWAGRTATPPLPPVAQRAGRRIDPAYPTFAATMSAESCCSRARSAPATARRSRTST